VKRLKRIGVDVELIANYPWVYMTKVNGVPVTEKFMANHGFTAFFAATAERWSDRRKVFAKIRELLSNADALPV
jgi:hypothetical protein